jgi:mevalonate kinase
MQVTASAPGKAILFGEHSVVYGKPAIAVAVDRRARVTIQKQDETEDNKIEVKVKNPYLSGIIDLKNDRILLENKKNEIGILDFIFKSLKKVNPEGGLMITVDLEIPLGAGLGSSAAVSVATIAAASRYNQINLSRNEIAEYAHQVELEVQGAASPIDTTISTFGGSIYLSKNAEAVIPLQINWDLPLVIGYTEKPGNTGELIESVRRRREAYPDIINPILDSMECITENAREALLHKDQKKLGDLMNINQGLLDALGVNTAELSNMVYTARNTGAIGSKITGAGGGGSIIVFCPDKLEKVVSALEASEKAFSAHLSSEGVQVKVEK